MPASRRDDLIDAATRVFCREGLANASIDDVIHEAGVSRMTLYNHFDSKDDLALAAMERYDRTFREHVREEIARRADDPVARLLAVFDVLSDWHAEPGFNGCGFARIAAETTERGHPLRALAEHHKQEFRTMIADLCREAGAEDPETLAAELCLLMDGATASAVVVGCEGCADRAKNAARKLLDY